MKHENWVKWEFSYKRNWKLGKSWQKFGKFTPKIWITKLERVQKFHFVNLREIMTKDYKTAPNFGNFVIIETSKQIDQKIGNFH